MSKQAFIMRGIPGSGKSSWVKANCPGWAVFSADQYFTDAAGVYNFRARELSQAHHQCFVGYLNRLLGGRDNVVVDNTNIRVFEIAPYYRLAEALGYEPTIIWVHADPSVAALRNVHGVPTVKVAEMAKSFEPLPSWWNVRHIYGSSAQKDG